MNLMKIGGAVLRDQNGFYRLVDILNNYSNTPLVLVVSAFYSTTKNLGKSARLAAQGQDKESNLILNQIIDKHILFARELLEDEKTFESLEILFLNSKQKIQDYLKGLSITGELTLRTLDMILSFGEYFALHTINHFLKEKGFNAISIDSTSIIVSDDNYGRAKPLIHKTSKKINEKILPLMVDDNIVITQGFVAKSQTNEITTMGIESSNLTASIIAEVLNIKRITFWTNVEGIRNADPHLVSKTFLIEQMSYDEAYKASVNGLKLLHTEMIDQIRKSNIEAIYRSALESNGGFTIINSDNRNINKLVLIQDNMIFCEKDFNSISEKSNFYDSLNLNKEIFNKINFKISKQDKTELVFPNKNSLIKFFENQGITKFNECRVISLMNVSQYESIKIISEIQKNLEINIYSIFISNDICSIVLSVYDNISPIMDYINSLLY